jgi:hypothetical protein
VLTTKYKDPTWKSFLKADDNHLFELKWEVPCKSMLVLNAAKHQMDIFAFGLGWDFFFDMYT